MWSNLLDSAQLQTLDANGELGIDMHFLNDAHETGKEIQEVESAEFQYGMMAGFSKALLMLLMVMGACAGSTGGGLKCARALLLFKSLRRNIRQLLNPRKVQVIRVNGKPTSEKVLDNTNAYLAAYVIIIIVSYLLISLDGYSVGTNISAVLCCFNNIGPGMEAVGPTCNFGHMSILSKLVLSADMLAGRLEIFPMLVLFGRNTWKSR